MKDYSSTLPEKLLLLFHPFFLFTELITLLSQCNPSREADAFLVFVSYFKTISQNTQLRKQLNIILKSNHKWPINRNKIKERKPINSSAARVKKQPLLQYSPELLPPCSRHTSLARKAGWGGKVGANTTPAAHATTPG